MPRPESVTIDLTSIQLTDAGSGQPVPLAGIGGAAILMLMRHRH